MKQITFQKTFTIEKIEKGTRPKDLLGDSLTAFFGKPLYWVKNKYNTARVERAFHLAEKANDHDFTHFMQNVLKG